MRPGSSVPFLKRGITTPDDLIRVVEWAGCGAARNLDRAGGERKEQCIVQRNLRILASGNEERYLWYKTELC